MESSPRDVNRDSGRLGSFRFATTRTQGESRIQLGEKRACVSGRSDVSGRWINEPRPRDRDVGKIPGHDEINAPLARCCSGMTVRCADRVGSSGNPSGSSETDSRPRQTVSSRKEAERVQHEGTRLNERIDGSRRRKKYVYFVAKTRSIISSKVCNVHRGTPHSVYYSIFCINFFFDGNTKKHCLISIDGQPHTQLGPVFVNEKMTPSSNRNSPIRLAIWTRP